MSSGVAPGWYPDPGSEGQLRYWNGSAWTEHVQPAGAPSPPVAEATHPDPGSAPAPAGLTADAERRLAALESKVGALERRLARGADALGDEEDN